MLNPHVSCVVPAYNASATIRESVESIFTGNFECGDEVIIIDDCSTDTTAEVIASLKKKFTSIIVLENATNKGCPATRNVGINIANNELIFNLDADNVLAPSSIAKLKKTLLEQRADMVAFSEYRYFIDTTARVTHYWQCLTGWCTVNQLFAGHINPGPGGNFLYTKESWERIGGYSEYGKGLHEAWGFTLKQLMSGNKLYVAPDTFYYHRHGHESLFVSESRNKPGELELLQKILAPYRDQFSATEWTYIQENPDWYHQLDKRPIKLSGFEIGKNGKLKLTAYGLFRKIINKLSLA